MEGTSSIETSLQESQENTPSSKLVDSGVVSDSASSGAKVNPRANLPKSPLAKRDKEIAAREPVEISLRSLLQAGVHFGHQTSRWCPAMGPYIHSSRNGIHIINLPHMVKAWEQARKAIVDVAARGGNVLFVGTKKQAQEPVVEEARRCGAFFVSRRWLGGMITNFQTIRKSIERLQKVEQILADEDTAAKEGGQIRYTKKERLMMTREREKLEYSLGGIRNMLRAPQMLFVVDIKREEIAIKEAKRLDIPVVALVDTNCDPRDVDYPIPSNDDGTRAIRLFCAAVSDAIMEGQREFKKRKVSEPTKDTRSNSRDSRGEKSTAKAVEVASPAVAEPSTPSE